MTDAVIVDAIRTPIGALGGILASVRPDDLVALVIKEIVQRNRLGILYKYTGEFDKAERLYRDALANLIEQYGEEYSFVATLYHNLGGLFHAREDFATADEPWASSNKYIEWKFAYMRVILYVTHPLPDQ